jgi:hypothetical protein
VYCTLAEHANDLQLLGRIFCRISELWQRGSPRTEAEAAVLDQVQGEYDPYRRFPLPPAFCGCEWVFVRDLAWQPNEGDPELVAGDLNRSLRTLRLEPDKPKVLPVPANDVERRVRDRLRSLRRRGAIPVTGVRVQANHTLYQPGDNDAPGVVLFSPSPNADIGLLSALAEELFHARDAGIDPAPELTDAVELLRADVRHWMYGRRARLPLRRTAGAEAYVADLWFHRPFLRDGYVNAERGRALRCLAQPGEPAGVELLPWNAEVGPSVVPDPAWLRWNDRCVPKIARAIADELAFDRLPILADALEEAGCTNADILNHCRQPNPHLHDCWVIELLLDES